MPPVSPIPRASLASARRVGVAGVVLVALAAIAPVTPSAVAEASSDGSPQFSLAPAVPQGTAIVIGRVVDAATERPIAGARVEAGQRLQDVCLTDGDGRFVVTNLPAGPLHFMAYKEGYAPGDLGQGWIGLSRLGLGPYGTIGNHGQVVTIRDGERRDDIVIRLLKYGLITGHVTDDAGDPVVGVLVHAYPRVITAGRMTTLSATSFVGETDDRGEFRIARLLTGEYVVGVPAISVTMPPTMQSPRHVVNNANAEVWAAQIMMGVPNGFGQTEGVFGGVSDGPWLHTALGQPEPVATTQGWSGYPTTYSPSATAVADATVLSVASGAEQSADVHLRLTPLVSVTGVLLDASGRPRMQSMRLSAGDAVVAVAVSNEHGQFRFASVPPGAYRIVVNAFPEPPVEPGKMIGFGESTSGVIDGATSVHYLAVSPWVAGETEWANEALTVDSTGASGVTIALRTGFRVSGRLVFAKPATQPSAETMAKIAFDLDPTDGVPSGTHLTGPLQTDAQGTLRSVGLPPGRYVLADTWRGLPAGWSVESAVLAGRDIRIDPLELGSQPADGLVITLTQTPSVVAGQVRSSVGTPDGDAAVVLFSTDRTHWSDRGMRSADVVSQRVSPDGQFSISRLPAGEYFAVAVADAVIASGLDPHLLDALAQRADRVTVVAQEQRTVNLITRTIR